MIHISKENPTIQMIGTSDTIVCLIQLAPRSL